MLFRFVARLYFCFLLLSSAVTTHAKKDAYWPLIPSDSLTGTVSFNAVRVLDEREDKSNFGLHMGMRKRPITTADSFPLALHKMIDRITQHATQRLDRELLVVVKDIEFKDVIRDIPTISSVYLRADWYLSNGAQYSLVKQTDSLYEFPLPQGYTTTLMAIANFLLTESVKEVAAITTPGPAASQILSELLATESRAREMYPIYHTSPQKGIYYTREQFLNNTPQVADFIHKHYGPDLYIDEFFLKDERGKKGRNLADPACFAIYNGEKWYHPYTQTDFKEMKRAGNDFYYYAIQKGIHLEDYSAVAGAGAGAGLLGTLISTAVAKVLQDREYRKPVPMADALYRMRIDPITGEGKRVERLR